MNLSEQRELVQIKCGSVRMEGMLELPPNPIGVVLFSHGSGSSRLSPRNNYVARALRNQRMGTLLMDLLTEQEDRDEKTRFNISLLTERLNGCTDCLLDNRTQTLPIGLFGASTGAAAALRVAAQRETVIAALVSRGGRTDLAGLLALSGVQTPTLLIVGGLDEVVIELNRVTYAVLQCEKTSKSWMARAIYLKSLASSKRLRPLPHHGSRSIWGMQRWRRHPCGPFMARILPDRFLENEFITTTNFPLLRACQNRPPGPRLDRRRRARQRRRATGRIHGRVIA